MRIMAKNIIIKGNDFKIVHFLYKEGDDDKTHIFNTDGYSVKFILHSSMHRFEVDGVCSSDNIVSVDIPHDLLPNGSYGVEVIMQKNGTIDHRSYYRGAFRVVESSNEAELPEGVVMCRDTVVIGLQEPIVNGDPNDPIAAIDLSYNIENGILTFRKD